MVAASSQRLALFITTFSIIDLVTKLSITIINAFCSSSDKLMAESKGNLSIVEEKLGLTKGYLSNSDTGVFYIPRSEFKNLNIPSGNENGANQYWLPGGNPPGQSPTRPV
ncbi:hypothetical protein [Xenorhabdus sp. BG5]|uniref:hypothetical protein n=1 Tax=Xenorhabdus sp. BG5 TaxID=2782014 RepID=UPI0030D98C79